MSQAPKLGATFILLLPTFKKKIEKRRLVREEQCRALLFAFFVVTYKRIRSGLLHVNYASPKQVMKASDSKQKQKKRVRLRSAPNRHRRAPPPTWQRETEEHRMTSFRDVNARALRFLIRTGEPFTGCCGENGIQSERDIFIELPISRNASRAGMTTGHQSLN